MKNARWTRVITAVSSTLGRLSLLSDVLLQPYTEMAEHSGTESEREREREREMIEILISSAHGGHVNCEEYDSFHSMITVSAYKNT